MENKKQIYFETEQQAKNFITKNNIKNYYFTTPLFLENGVDLVYTEKGEF